MEQLTLFKLVRCVSFVGSLQGSSVKLGATWRRLARPLRKDDAHTSIDVNNVRLHVHIYMYVCMYVCIYIYIYICIQNNM